MQKKVWRSVLVLAVVFMLVPCICFAGPTYDKVKDAGVVQVRPDVQQHSRGVF